jgi:RHS repeat-associated protein
MASLIEAGKQKLEAQVGEEIQAAKAARAAVNRLINPPAPDAEAIPAEAAQAKAAGAAGAVQTLAQFAGAKAGQLAQVVYALSDPEGALIGAAAGALDEPLALATNWLSALLPSFPAATLTSLALGFPHAHTAHPPSGPPPAPPTPLPPLGPTLLGTCVSVLINGKPAARCGDLGFNPTCCGLPPMAMFEIFTGSSKVFIGGARAARMGLDITWHCKPGAREPSAPKPSIMGQIARAAGKVAAVAPAVGAASAAAAAAVEAQDQDDAAMAAAETLAAAMLAAQLAADAAAMALSAMMGKDQPEIPPNGTPGLILLGSPNVLIGGLPLPSSAVIIGGVLKCVKGLLRRGRAAFRKRLSKKCQNGAPIDAVTGACVHDFSDFTLPEPVPFVWQRFYDSRWVNREGLFGPGWRHALQHELRQTVDGFVYTDPEGFATSFPAVPPGGMTVCGGYRLRHGRDGVLHLDATSGPALDFLPDHGPGPRPPYVVRYAGGYSQKCGYDQAGRLVTVHDSEDRRLEFQISAQGRVVRITLKEPGAAHRVLAVYQYHSSGLLATASDALAGVERYEYDAGCRMTRNIDRRGFSIFNEYDPQGRCVREYCQDGRHDVRMEYFPEARRSIATFADGALKVYYFDKDLVPTEIVYADGGSEKHELGPDGRVTAEVDPLGNQTTWSYNAWGAPVTRKTPHGNEFGPFPDDLNPPDPLAYELPEHPLAWEHGGLVDPATIGRPTVKSQALWSLPAPLFNAIIADPEPRRPVEPTRKYDLLGRRIEETDAYGRTERWTYDAVGNVLAHQDGDGRVTRYTIASWNYVGRETSPAGGSVSYDFSLRGEINKVVDAGGTLSEYEYDGKDRIAAVKRHGRIKERYRYDKADNLIEKTDFFGRPLLSLEIGPGNLPTKRRLADGEEQTFDYDKHGRLTVAATGDLRCEFQTDPWGRAVKDLRDGLGVAHEYSPSALLKTTYFDRFRVIYDHAEDGSIRITDPTGAVHQIRAGTGGVIVRELADGAVSLGQFDGDGRCLRKAAWRRGEQHIYWQHTYRYSAEGDLLSDEEQSGRSTSYQYDEAHRLMAASPPRAPRQLFRYDAAGNLYEQPGLTDVTFEEGNRLKTANGDTFLYNDRNHISERRGRHGRQEFFYDGHDRLVRAVLNGEPWVARYDPLCRRVSKTWKGQTTRYYWDGLRLMAEVAPSGALRLYVYADEQALVPLMFIEYDSMDADPASGKRYYLFTNQLGAPERVEDSEGREVWSATLAPYGSAAPGLDCRLELNLRFPGHYHDPETGLHYNRFRYYDPELGRYIQSDPMGVAGGINLYPYCSRPGVEVDLDGLTARHALQRAGAALRNKIGRAKEAIRGLFRRRPPPPPPPPSAFPNLQRGGGRTNEHANRVAQAIQTGRPSIRQNRSVTVIEHADGTVSVGLSGNDPKRTREGQKLAQTLNDQERRAGRPPIYRATDQPVNTAGLRDPGSPANPSPLPGTCSEPHAAQAAGSHDSPPQSYQVVHSGPGPVPEDHQMPGRPTAGPGGAELMQPCNTCQNNADNYDRMANQGSRPAPGGGTPPREENHDIDNS